MSVLFKNGVIISASGRYTGDVYVDGDKIKTIGGFYGKVEMVKEDLVVISCDPDGTKMTIAKSAIATVQNSEVENDAEPSS